MHIIGNASFTGVLSVVVSGRVPKALTLITAGSITQSFASVEVTSDRDRSGNYMFVRKYMKCIP